jgi:hypothetical protein
MWRAFWISLSIVVIGPSLGWAADLEVIDKNCWAEVFDDDEFDQDDPHLKLQGPAEYASLTNLFGRNWNNDIESVIVGTSATVHAWIAKDFKGPEMTFGPGERVAKLSKLKMANAIQSMKITCRP